MDINLTLKSDGFESVFLINGKLLEGGQIEYGENDVIYITVLPLDASLLPYTIMLVGGVVKCNKKLASCYKLNETDYYFTVKPRYNYVYSPQGIDTEQKSTAEKFFFLLKNKKAAAARALMTKDLSDSVDDSALISFFDGFKDIVFDSNNNYYLIKDNDMAMLHAFVLKDSLIDNILEL